MVLRAILSNSSKFKCSDPCAVIGHMRSGRDLEVVGETVEMERPVVDFIL